MEYVNKQTGEVYQAEEVDLNNLCDGDLSEGKLEVLNILAQHILSDMEADLELQIKRLESYLWDKFRYTEDAVPEKSVK